MKPSAPLRISICHIAQSVLAAGLGLLLLASKTAAQTPPAYLHAPAGNQYATFNPGGLTVLGDGRFLKPIGKHTPLARWPHGLTLSPDGQTAFVACEGVGYLLKNWQSGTPMSQIVWPEGKPAHRGDENGGAAAFSPDGKTLYWSGGDSGTVNLFDVATQAKIGAVSLNVPIDSQNFVDSDVMDLQISADGKYLYCADVTNFRVAIVDTAQKQVISSIHVGRYPYALTLTGTHVFVANIGMFEYSAIPPPAPGSGFDPRGLTFPAYAVPSKEAREGRMVEGRFVPGLGDPNAPQAFSVWGIDVSNPAKPVVTSRDKTGILVGVHSDQGDTVGGSGPNFLVSRGDAVYVSDGNNDMVQRLDLAHQSRVWRTRIIPSPLVAKLRGVGPSGMALSPDGTRLYVAESGINALGVIDTQSGKVLGQIPTAWYPYRVTVSPDGRKIGVICFRGFGNGPNGGKHIPASPFLDMKGTFTVLNTPHDADLKILTAHVLAYNGIVDKRADRAAMASPVIPAVPGKLSPQIKYVVFITKENHTFDTIFDRVPGSKNDPSILRWGYHQTLDAPGQPTLTDVAVMTNHNALARQFTVSDNFYMQPEASGVGHRWLIGVQPNNWCQMTYTLGWNFSATSTAPGRRASFGSNGSIAPEDYPEAGTMWDQLARHGLTFRNYGEGFEFAGVGEDENEDKTGAREVVNIPMEKIVYDNTCRDYPIFNMNIPDQYRADWFAHDFTQNFIIGKKTMPHFVNIAICNDHGTSPNPSKGYPYVASWMADNDLALGRIVDFLSHTKYWKNMAIFVTQDDSGGEPDHIDAQRSVLLVISPWTKHHYVSHRHTTILSMHRTLYEIFGLTPLNMFDALASDFSDCFTTKPDFRPYNHVGVDARVFDPAKARDAHDPNYRQARLRPSIIMDDPDEVENVLREGAPQVHHGGRQQKKKKEIVGKVDQDAD